MGNKNTQRTQIKEMHMLDKLALGWIIITEDY